MAKPKKAVSASVVLATPVVTEVFTKALNKFLMETAEVLLRKEIPIVGTPGTFVKTIFQQKNFLVNVDITFGKFHAYAWHLIDGVASLRDPPPILLGPVVIKQAEKLAA